MQPSLAERAAKILDEFGDLPLRSLVVQSELSVSDRSLCNLGIDVARWQLFTDEHSVFDEIISLVSRSESPSSGDDRTYEYGVMQTSVFLFRGEHGTWRDVTARR
jgi:hypothetical protein